MEEKSEIKSKLYKLIGLNLISFAIIFTIFGIFIFLLVQNMAYNNINQSLYDAKNQLSKHSNENVDLIIEDRDFKIWDRDSFFQDTIKTHQDLVISKRVSNPNIIVIMRDMEREYC